jgi:hypothetical protein
VVEAFARQHGMAWSRSFDRDPMRPFACYFLMLKVQGFVRVCAVDPFMARSRFGSHFVIDGVPPRGKGRRWEYSPDERQDKLKAILEEAKAVAEQKPDGKPLPRAEM